MKNKKLLSLPSLIMGSWGAQLGTAEMASFIEECLNLGYNCFDHADIYGGHTTELEFGKAMTSMGVEKNVDIITKCGIAYPSSRNEFKVKHYSTTRDHVLSSVENSLRNLSQEKLFGLLIHRPGYLMDFDELAHTLQYLKDQDLVDHIGVSNFPLELIKQLHELIPIDMIQDEIHPLAMETFKNGTLSFCQQNNIQVTAWSPLAGGKLVVNNGAQISGEFESFMKEMTKKPRYSNGSIN